MARLRVGDDGLADPETHTSLGPGPYISTDRADLIRMLERVELLRKEVVACPTNGKVTQGQFLKVRDEVWALVTLARRVKERVDAT